MVSQQPVVATSHCRDPQTKHHTMVILPNDFAHLQIHHLFLTFRPLQTPPSFPLSLAISLSRIFFYQTHHAPPPLSPASPTHRPQVPSIREVSLQVTTNFRRKPPVQPVQPHRTSIISARRPSPLLTIQATTTKSHPLMPGEPRSRPLGRAKNSPSTNFFWSCSARTHHHQQHALPPAKQPVFRKRSRPRCPRVRPSYVPHEPHNNNTTTYHPQQTFRPNQPPHLLSSLPPSPSVTFSRVTRKTRSIRPLPIRGVDPGASAHFPPPARALGTWEFLSLNFTYFYLKENSDTPFCQFNCCRSIPPDFPHVVVVVGGLSAHAHGCEELFVVRRSSVGGCGTGRARADGRKEAHNARQRVGKLETSWWGGSERVWDGVKRRRDPARDEDRRAGVRE